MIILFLLSLFFLSLRGASSEAPLRFFGAPPTDLAGAIFATAALCTILVAII